LGWPEVASRPTFQHFQKLKFSDYGETPPVVLTIAGFRPLSGAGVTADIKTIAAHGCYGVACITAMTVQSTAGVRRVEAGRSQPDNEILQEFDR